MTFDRKAATAAVTKQLAEWKTNSIADEAIWRAVNRALDVAEDTDQMPVDLGGFGVWRGGGLSWSLIAVTRTKYRARKFVRARKADRDRAEFMIHPLPPEV